jgi:hypothetical protein
MYNNNKNNDDLINELIKKGYLKSEKVIKTMKTIKREDFI